MHHTQRGRADGAAAVRPAARPDLRGVPGQPDRPGEIPAEVTRVLVIDQQPLFRDALARLISASPGLTIAAVVADIPATTVGPPPAGPTGGARTPAPGGVRTTPATGGTSGTRGPAGAARTGGAAVGRTARAAGMHPPSPVPGDPSVRAARDGARVGTGARGISGARAAAHPAGTGTTAAAVGHSVDRPPVAVLDSEATTGGLREGVAELVARGYAVLVLAPVATERSVVDAITGGAHGYLTRRATAQDLVGAIRMVAARRGEVAPDVARLLVSALRDSRGRHGGENLSVREREVVSWVARGYTDDAIAARLAISVSTVRSHLDRIGNKTGLRRRADLTRLAYSIGGLDDALAGMVPAPRGTAAAGA